jgi:tRNA-Thr(GGU) m(6)t(6)A37 methyltransferase TsaA
MSYAIKPIGLIHSVLKNLDDCPRQESQDAPAALVEIFPEYIEGIKDISPGSEIILLTWLHKADRTVIVTTPRGKPEAGLTGIFSTRSPARPNPIGLHHVKVTGITDDNKIQVSALEVLDQTPLIDIKPVLKKRS